jgi:hypothetical protein
MILLNSINVLRQHINTLTTFLCVVVNTYRHTYLHTVTTSLCVVEQETWHTSRARNHGHKLSTKFRRHKIEKLGLLELLH